MQKFLFFLLLNWISITLFSQTKTIKGKVISEEFEPLPFTSIFINDTIKIGETDLDGNFKITIPTNIKKLKFAYVGILPTTIELTETCNYIEIVLSYYFIYDFISLKRAERKTIKRLKKIPKIHKQAYQKGIFRTEKPCYKYFYKSKQIKF